MQSAHLCKVNRVLYVYLLLTRARRYTLFRTVNCISCGFSSASSSADERSERWVYLTIDGQTLKQRFSSNCSYCILFLNRNEQSREEEVYGETDVDAIPHFV